MALFNKTTLSFGGIGVRQFAVALVVGAVPAYIVAKTIRAIVHNLFPGFIPGETNTALLASPRPNTTSDTVHAKDLDNVAEYDYVIVGGGTAGCVLASRLTENPNVTVLVVESGQSDLKQLLSRIPAGFAKLLKSAVDWNFTTEPEPECKGRRMYWPRGKMLGGCSAINAMMYNRGAPDDFDEWERLGNKGWTYSILQPYMSKAETFHHAERALYPLSDSDLKHHGKSGPWQVGYSYITELSKIFLEACPSIGVPRIADVNTSSGVLGATQTQTFIDQHGQRASTAVSYINQSVASRSNLKIAVGVTCTKIVFDQSGSEPRAMGVEIAASSLTPIRYLAKARREVIVCAGAIHTPHVLKLSGIGDASELRSHGIPVVVDKPGVGANLADHLALPLVFKSKLESLHRNVPLGKSLLVLLEWLRTRAGPMTSNMAEAHAFVRIADRDDAPASLKEQEESSGPTSADVELISVPVAFVEHGLYPDRMPQSGDWGSVMVVMLRPKSRGSITLADRSPFTPPKVRANYLTDKYDRDAIVYGIRLCDKLVRSEAYKAAFDGFYKSFTDLPADPTDEQYLEYARGKSETLYHPMCTAKMGPASDKMSVVDERLRVHGVTGLRVVDASIFPKPVACHPCAVVVTVAERAADLIKEDWKR